MYLYLLVFLSKKAKSKKTTPYVTMVLQRKERCTHSSEDIVAKAPICFIAKITPPLTQPATTSPPKSGAAKLDVLRAPANLGQGQRC